MSEAPHLISIEEWVKMIEDRLESLDLNPPQPTELNENQ